MKIGFTPKHVRIIEVSSFIGLKLGDTYICHHVSWQESHCSRSYGFFRANKARYMEISCQGNLIVRYMCDCDLEQLAYALKQYRSGISIDQPSGASNIYQKKPGYFGEKHGTCSSGQKPFKCLHIFRQIKITNQYKQYSIQFKKSLTLASESKLEKIL